MDAARHQETVRREFGKQARHFAEAGLTLSNEDYLRWMVDVLAPAPHWQVLDVAPGTGHLPRALAPRVRRGTAVDLTPAMLAGGRRPAGAARGRGAADPADAHGRGRGHRRALAGDAPRAARRAREVGGGTPRRARRRPADRHAPVPARRRAALPPRLGDPARTPVAVGRRSARLADTLAEPATVRAPALPAQPIPGGRRFRKGGEAPLRVC